METALSDKKPTDWEFVKASALSIKWIMECDQVANAGKTLVQIWAEKFSAEYPGVYQKPLNKGFLMMSAYSLFVYLHEKEAKKLNYDTIKVDTFKIIVEDKGKDHTQSKVLCPRIRNAISHGNYWFEEDILFMADRNPIYFPKKNYVKFSIHIVQFGEWIYHFANEVSRQKAA